MTLLRRNNYKWNINELLALQREYELLGMSIQDISVKHQRTIDSILFRLQQEEFIETWIDATGYQEYSKTQSCFPESIMCKSDKDIHYEESELDDEDSDYEDEDSDYEESELDDDVDSDYEDEDSDYEESELDDDVDSDYEDEDEEDDYENDNNISSLNQRVWSLETAVSDIKDMIGTLLSKFSSSNQDKTFKTPQLSVEI